MKKSDELRIQTRKMIAKNLIVLVALAVVAIVGAFSWYSNDIMNATASGIKARASAVDGLEYYIVPPSASDQYDSINAKLAANAEYNATHTGEKPKNTEWHTGTITFDYTDPEFKFMEDLFLCEVTGDGKTFTIPKLIQYGEIAYVDTSADFEDAVANDNYMSFDIYFRTQKVRDVAMKSNSSIASAEKITNPADEEQMKNAAIGAVRMAVLNGDSRELLWVPEPCVWFDGLNDTLRINLSGSDFAGKGSICYNATLDKLERTTEDTTDHAYYDKATKTRQIVKANNTNVIASTSVDNNNLGKDITIVTLDNEDADNGYHYGHVRINLWVEGEDAESRLKMVGGKFDMSLVFDLK